MKCCSVYIVFNFACRAFGYVHQYCRDIHFDNVYITTYFRQIDARRRRAVSYNRTFTQIRICVCANLSICFRERSICCLSRKQSKRAWSTHGAYLSTPASSCVWYCMLLWSLCSALNSCSDIQAVYLMEQVCHFCSSYGTKQKWKCHVFIQVSQTHNSAPNSCYWLNRRCYVGLTKDP